MLLKIEIKMKKKLLLLTFLFTLSTAPAWAMEDGETINADEHVQGGEHNENAGDNLADRRALDARTAGDPATMRQQPETDDDLDTVTIQAPQSNTQTNNSAAIESAVTTYGEPTAEDQAAQRSTILQELGFTPEDNPEINSINEKLSTEISNISTSKGNKWLKGNEKKLGLAKTAKIQHMIDVLGIQYNSDVLSGLHKKAQNLDGHTAEMNKLNNAKSALEEKHKTETYYEDVGDVYEDNDGFKQDEEINTRVSEANQKRINAKYNINKLNDQWMKNYAKRNQDGLNVADHNSRINDLQEKVAKEKVAKESKSNKKKDKLWGKERKDQVKLFKQSAEGQFTDAAYKEKLNKSQELYNKRNDALDAFPTVDEMIKEGSSVLKERQNLAEKSRKKSKRSNFWRRNNKANSVEDSTPEPEQEYYRSGPESELYDGYTHSGRTGY
ncbi:MAG: hypothetical protein ACJAZS_000312 [Alteromonas naphthalenivorans]|jgi:hypothetical protein